MQNAYTTAEPLGTIPLAEVSGLALGRDDRGVPVLLALEVAETAPARLARSWRDPSCSHAEGVVLLRDGHLLVVKEKDPVALVEFGPPGVAPKGFGPDRWLGAEEQWQVVEGDVALTALAAWEPTASVADLCPDLSDAAIAPNGDLVLVSDQACAILVIHPAAPADEPWAGRFDAAASWRIEGLGGKPEGIVVLPEGDLLIACDRRKVKENLFLVGRGIWR